ncbi:MAG: TIGR04283 family arsenosugar biosynthesis glycosyltransferase [Planctomycetota bacterium]
MNPGNLLIIMTRHPTPGKAKTRLIPLLGEEGAARFHRQSVRHTLSVMASSPENPDLSIEIRCEGASPKTMCRIFGGPASYAPQCEGDLGTRLLDALKQAMDRGHQRIVIIGTDCPDLDKRLVADAFSSLDTHDLVLGPSVDGGYYLIGLKNPHRELFENIPWGGDRVFSTTMQKAGILGLTLAVLPSLRDIDTPDDLALWARERAASSSATPALSVIIPTLNEEAHLAATMASALGTHNVEIIVSDGGSRDRTVTIATCLGARIAVSHPSRGIQLNAGARMARGDTLLFLHADTLLPHGYLDGVQTLLETPGTSLGAFGLKVDSLRPALRLVEWGVGLRSRFLGLPYGDQGLFMKHDLFDANDGFPEWPSMEDFDLVQRLRKLGSVRISPLKVLTSARKWEALGVGRTTLLHQGMILRHLFIGRRQEDAALPAINNAATSGAQEV